MKSTKVKAIIVVTLLLCMIVLSSVSAAPVCPNCTSFNTEGGYQTYPTAPKSVCIPDSCDKQPWRTDYVYYCNACYYNWFGYTVASWWDHSLDNCPNE